MENSGLNFDNILIDDSNESLLDNVLNIEENDKDESSNKEDKLDIGAILKEETKEDKSTKEDKEEVDDLDKSISDNDKEDEEDKEDKSTDKSDSSSPFTSIATAFKQDGILSNLSDDDLKNIKTADDFSEAINKEITSRLEDRVKRVDEALNNGVEPEVIKQNESIINYLNNLSDESLNDESENGIKLRTNLIVQDYINKGFTQERAIKEANKSITAGTDLEDAKEALEANKNYYNSEYQKILQDAKNESEKERLATIELHKDIEKKVLKDENIIEGLELTEEIRKKAIDNIQKSVFVDKEGNKYSAIQKYEKENPSEFMAKIGILYTITDGFKDLSKLVNTSKSKVKKSAIKELEHTLLSGIPLNGELNFANNLGSDDVENSKGEFILDIN